MMDFGPSTAESVVQSVNVLSSSPTIVPAATFTTPVPVVDVRGYSGYYLTCFAQSNVVATAFNPVLIDLQWYLDINKTVLLYEDVVHWWADASSGAFAFSGGTLYMQDINHGPYLSFSVRNNGAADAQKFSYSLTLTTRNIPSPFVRQNASIDSMPSSIGFNVIGAGATINIPFPYVYGRSVLNLVTGAVGLTFSYMLANVASSFNSFALAANTRTKEELILPKHAFMLQVLNGGAVSNYGAFMFTQNDKM